MINELGFCCCAAASCKDFCLFFLFFGPRFSKLNDWELRICTEGSTQTGNRGVFVSPCCGWTFALSKKKRKKKKETVVLMLLEQLPTWMTKLCLKPFSPQPDSHECWEIVLLLSDTQAMSAGLSTNANNWVCKTHSVIYTGNKRLAATMRRIAIRRKHVSVDSNLLRAKLQAGIYSAYRHRAPGVRLATGDQCNSF